MKKFCFFLLAICNFFVSHAQNIPVSGASPLPATVSPITLPAPFTPVAGALNFSRTFIPLRPITSNSDITFTLNPTSGVAYMAKVTTSYVNGLGNTIQAISRGCGVGTSLTKDILLPYDNRPSLTTNSLLPYSLSPGSTFQSNPFTGQQAYYSTAYPAEGHTSYAQNIVSYPSKIPTVQSYSPGSSLVGNAKGTTVTTTIDDGSAHISMTNVTVDGSGNTVPGVTGLYAPYELTIKTTTTADGAQIIEYMDKDNREVCKQVNAGASGLLTTYYVYDDKGQLSFVVTPKGVPLFLAGNPNARNLEYAYTYNADGSPVISHKPDQGGDSYVVYDKKNRPVLMQTPLLQTQGMYKFNLYDDRDRVIISGLFSDANSYKEWQARFNASNLSTYPGSAAFFFPTSLMYLYTSGITGSYPTSIPNCEIDQVNYYDTYKIPRTFNSSFSASYAVGGIISPETPTPYLMAQGMLTASLTRVRDGASASTFRTTSDLWETAVYFYDLKGRLLQVQSLNASHATTYSVGMTGATTSAWDVLTNQYSFAGLKLREILLYNDVAGSAKPTTKIVNLYDYDLNNGGRALSVNQRIDDGIQDLITSYTYDDMGRVLTKSLGGVEIQNYDYNIRNQLTGINRDYVTNPCGAEGAHASFGITLSYDYGFTNRYYDGGISGIIWRGAAHTSPMRSYGYQYDVAGRMTNAEFRQFIDPTIKFLTPCSGISPVSYPTWNKSASDYTVSNITYDVNGNIGTMQQRGSTPTGPVNMDDLHYVYNGYSNSLHHVTDNISTNYGLGDFQDVAADCGTTSVIDAGASGLTESTTTICADYSYDADGNLKADKNKAITAIAYNEMDKPMEVDFVNGSRINNIYDARGTLLTKTVNDVVAGTTHVYRYAGPFVFEDNVLQYALHAEGRARYDATTKGFTYDYFVKDHLGNVRTVVTGNQTNLYVSPTVVPNEYEAGHELKDAVSEGRFFANLNRVRYPKPATSDQTDMMAARLNGADSTRLGTAILLHVMPGDQIDLSAESYYNADNNGHAIITSPMLGAILSTLTGGVSSPGGDAAVNINQNNMSGTYNAYEAMLNNLANTNAPRAFANYLVFDDNMNLIPEQSGAIQASATPNTWIAIGTPAPLTMQQSGYIFAYLSDEEALTVYFDKLKVTHYSGTVLQEQHYYPHGLAINTGESLTTLHNRYKYQGKELQEDLGVGLMDFTARNYDQQIGRFWGLDPMSQFPSGYTGMGNDPANHVDPSGLWSSITHGGETEYGSNSSLFLKQGAVRPLGDWWDSAPKNLFYDDYAVDPATGAIRKVGIGLTEGVAVQGDGFTSYVFDDPISKTWVTSNGAGQYDFTIHNKTFYSSNDESVDHSGSVQLASAVGLSMVGTAETGIGPVVIGVAGGIAITGRYIYESYHGSLDNRYLEIDPQTGKTDWSKYHTSTQFAPNFPTPPPNDPNDDGNQYYGPGAIGVGAFAAYLLNAAHASEEAYKDSHPDIEMSNAPAPYTAPTSNNPYNWKWGIPY